MSLIYSRSVKGNYMVESKWLLDAADEGLRNRFKETKKLLFNSNSKGGNYENILAQYLESYLGNLVDFHTRSGILDAGLEALTLFSLGENEFDIVATYNTASPKIVIKHGNISYIPWDAVAFLIEVKQTLTTDNLRHDLKKLDKAKKLHLSNRFESKLGPITRVDFPLKILFYYENKVAQETLEDILVSNDDFWDILVIFQEDRMYANSRLPFITRLQYILKSDKQRFARFNEYSLIQFLIVLQSSLMSSHYVNAITVFYNLLRANPPKASNPDAD